MSAVEMISQLLDALNKQNSPIPLDVALWDTETIALYLKRNKAVVRERITPEPSFPKAIRIATTQGRAQPLYRACEVIEWALSHRDKH